VTHFCDGAFNEGHTMAGIEENLKESIADETEPSVIQVPKKSGLFRAAAFFFALILFAVAVFIPLCIIFL
jgi:hypothetical protein